MSFWTRSVKELTYDDVDSFCRTREHENEIVEYRTVRTEVNEHRLFRTVAAMANWWGGRILVGVDAKDGLPITPISGFRRKPNLEETIHQICRARENVYPPVLTMEVGVVDIPNTNDQVVAVIEVSPSPHVPHRTDHDTRLYVRGTGLNDKRDDDDFTRYGTSGDEYWLSNRRAAAVAERERHIESVRGIVQARVEPWERTHPRYGACPRACIYVLPAFPGNPLTSRADLGRIVASSQLRCDQYPDALFGLHPEASSTDYVRFRRQSRGLVREVRVSRSDSSQQYFALGANLFGVVFVAWSIQPDARERSGGVPCFDGYLADSLAARLLLYTLRLYRRVGYHGVARIGFRLDDAHAAALEVDGNLAGEEYTCYERGLLAGHEDLVNGLYERRVEVLVSLSTEWRWAFNWQDLAASSTELQAFKANLPEFDLEPDFR